MILHHILHFHAWDLYGLRAGKFNESVAMPHQHQNPM